MERRKVHGTKNHVFRQILTCYIPSKRMDATKRPQKRRRCLIQHPTRPVTQSFTPAPSKNPNPKKSLLSIGQNEEELLITQKILGAFLNGYSGIILTSEKIFTVPQTKAIRRMAGRLYMRVMEADSKCVYIQSLMDESKASLEQAIQRMHLISSSMVEGAHQCARKQRH